MGYFSDRFPGLKEKILRKAWDKKMKQSSPIPPSKIFQAALDLGGDELVIESYNRFQDGNSGWFFSKNPSLSGKRKNDFTLKTWEGWDKINPEKRIVLLDLAELEENPERNNENLEKLIGASKKWRKDLLAIFWGLGEENRGTWTCNIFVGESIYWAGKNTSKDGKYLSAKQIHSNASPFKKVDKSDLIPGTIVTFNKGHHVEIITKVPVTHWIADDGFCSIGAGRVSSWFTAANGVESCDGEFSSDKREIDNPNNGYHSV